MKQTVEQAAHESYLGNWEVDADNTPEFAYEEGFKSGAAWQKEQGIDWISIEDKLPDNNEEFATTILITDGKIIKVWHIIHNQVLNTGNFNTTHWAYINLPKTDK